MRHMLLYPFFKGLIKKASFRSVAQITTGSCEVHQTNFVRIGFDVYWIKTNKPTDKQSIDKK